MIPRCWSKKNDNSAKRLCAAWKYLLRWKSFEQYFQVSSKFLLFLFLTTSASAQVDYTGFRLLRTRLAKNKQHIVVELDVLHTLHHGITQNEDKKFLFRPVSESQLHEVRLLRDLKDWVRFLSQPKYVCMNLYFLCICLINLISFMAKQWTDQLCQRKLSSGRSQCWTSLLTYWSAQLRFPKTLPI